MAVRGAGLAACHVATSTGVTSGVAVDVGLGRTGAGRPAPPALAAREDLARGYPNGPSSAASTALVVSTVASSTTLGEALAGVLRPGNAGSPSPTCGGPPACGGGWRFQAFATDTAGGQLAHLEARHRAHARVEDRIRCGKDTGLGRFPSRQETINRAWLELALTAIDLIAWTQTTLLDGALAASEPKALRYRLLHVAARLVRGQRRLRLKIADHWPWRTELAAAFQRLQALPRPQRI